LISPFCYILKEREREREREREKEEEEFNEMIEGKREKEKRKKEESDVLFVRETIKIKINFKKKKIHS
jgi:hypothetical protein